MMYMLKVMCQTFWMALHSRRLPYFCCLSLFIWTKVCHSLLSHHLFAMFSLLWCNSPLCFRCLLVRKQMAWTSWVWFYLPWCLVWRWRNSEKKGRNSFVSSMLSTRPPWCWCPGSCGEYSWDFTVLIDNITHSIAWVFGKRQVILCIPYSLYVKNVIKVLSVSAFFSGKFSTACVTGTSLLASCSWWEVRL